MLSNMETKTCSKCGLTKPVEQFNRKRGSYEYQCKECHRKYVNAHYAKNADKYRVKTKERNANRKQRIIAVIRETKAEPCMDCGKKYPYYVMDFDHRDPSLKSFSVTTAISRRWSLDIIQEEIEKCDVVCSNCHRERTAQRGQWDMG